MDGIYVVNKQLKTEFVKAIKNASKSSKDEPEIKIVLDVTDYLENMDNNETVREYLSENIQEAIREVNSTYRVISIRIGMDNVKVDDGRDIKKDKIAGIKAVICTMIIDLGNN